MNTVVLTSGIAVAELGGLIALGVLLIVSRHQLDQARTERVAAVMGNRPLGTDGNLVHCNGSQATTIGEGAGFSIDIVMCTKRERARCHRKAAARACHGTVICGCLFLPSS